MRNNLLKRSLPIVEDTLVQYLVEVIKVSLGWAGASPGLAYLDHSNTLFYSVRTPEVGGMATVLFTSLWQTLKKPSNSGEPEQYREGSVVNGRTHGTWDETFAHFFIHRFIYLFIYLKWLSGYSSIEPALNARCVSYVVLLFSHRNTF
jgi:hypothetical protein